VSDLTELQRRIHAVMLELQPGEVVSYGEVARRAGRPGRARAVGSFLAEFGDGLPWWRVVHRDGSLAAPNTRAQQRALRAEGVDVMRNRVTDDVP
jgi:methylated-DNA-protein-cysteine methyltransferase related protein